MLFQASNCRLEESESRKEQKDKKIKQFNGVRGATGKTFVIDQTCSKYTTCS